ncbi:MAG: hypothetical protein ACI9FO_000863 [Methylophagaceae bacterium]|jgi:hypothetical protein
MKMFVNLVQIMLIAGMVYPVYAVWNNDQLSNFCVELKSNMTKKNLLNLAEQKNIKLNLDLDNIDELRWQAWASVPVSFSNYACQINGLGNRVASAKMVTK